MCKVCGHKSGTTKHLLYWQAEWFKRFLLTWWHIINRKAYWKWYYLRYGVVLNSKINKWISEIDEGFRMDLDEILGDK